MTEARMMPMITSTRDISTRVNPAREGDVGNAVGIYIPVRK
jgi:hypothetical protein